MTKHAERNMDEGAGSNRRGGARRMRGWIAALALAGPDGAVTR